MKRGENIYRRKDGRWEARYIKGYDLSGKIVYGFCYGKSYSEAKGKAEMCRDALRNNVPPPGSNDRRRFAFFCEDWLAARRTRVKESTYAKYCTVARKHILPKLGECCPLGFSTALVDRFAYELLREGLSAATVRDTLVVLRSVLKHAALRFPGTFPNVEINYPKEPKKEARVLTAEEQRRFMRRLREEPDTVKLGVLLALTTGLRIGELCALRWENVSLRDRTIRVNATMQRLPDLTGEGGSRTKIVLGEPKSESSRRTIPIPDSMIGLCREFDPRCPAAYVLTGTPDYMEPRKLQRRLKKLTAGCGLKNVHFHTLRHSFATRCMEVGFEIKSLSEILGHANTSITLDCYVHASMKVKRDNMDRLAKAGF